MKENVIRKYHGLTGILLSIFIIIQVGSGTIIALNTIIVPGLHEHGECFNVDGHGISGGENSLTGRTGLTEIIHHHGVTIIQILRIVLGIGIFMMVISGSTIYLMAHIRKKKSV